MEAGKSKICSVGWQAGHLGELMVQFSLKAYWLETQESWWNRWSLKMVFWRISLGWKAGLFVLFSPLTDQMKPTHIMEGKLLTSKSTNF